MRSTVYPGIRSTHGWSHFIHSQSLGNACWYSVHSLLFIHTGAPAHGQVQRMFKMGLLSFWKHPHRHTRHWLRFHRIDKINEGISRSPSWACRPWGGEVGVAAAQDSRAMMTGMTHTLQSLAQLSGAGRAGSPVTQWYHHRGMARVTESQALRFFSLN